MYWYWLTMKETLIRFYSGKLSMEGVLNVPEGRYILKVNERNITVVEASAASVIKECRILVSKDALTVGGQEEEGAAGFTTTQQLVFGGLVVVTAGVGGNLIYENNNGDGQDKSDPVSQ